MASSSRLPISGSEEDLASWHLAETIHASISGVRLVRPDGSDRGHIASS